MSEIYFACLFQFKAGQMDAIALSQTYTAQTNA